MLNYLCIVIFKESHWNIFINCWVIQKCVQNSINHVIVYFILLIDFSEESLISIKYMYVIHIIDLLTKWTANSTKTLKGSNNCTSDTLERALWKNKLIFHSFVP